MMGSMLRRGAIDSGCAATSGPNQVGGLTATPSGTTTINLVWDADSTASPNEPSQYDIERSNDGSTGWSVIATISAPAVSYSDTTLSAGTTRHYRIFALNCADKATVSASASATTAAASIAPSWSLDFSSGTPSGYTLTRASTGTYVDSSGYIASASTDVARLTHNSSGSRLGLLVEEQRTNLCLRSQEFDNATWSLIGLKAFGSGSTANAATAPDNTTTADLITENSTTGLRGIWQNAFSNQGNGVAVCMSVYAKKPSTNGRNVIGIALELAFGGYCGKRFDLTTGSAVGADYNTNTTNLTNLNYGVSDAGNGWYRCWVSVTVNSTNTYQMRISPMVSSTTTFSFGVADYAGDNTSGILIWGAQFEKGIQPSSYIPTTTASVTREADLAHVLDSSITNWGDPGALVVHFYPPSQAGTLLSTDDASTAQVGIEASTTTAARAFWSSGSTSTGTIGTGVQKAVHYWNGSTSKFCINGGTVQSGTNNFTIANADFVTLGAEATDSSGVPGTFSQYANCVIRKVEFYSGTLTDANLQTITT